MAIWSGNWGKKKFTNANRRPALNAASVAWNALSNAERMRRQLASRKPVAARKRIGSRTKTGFKNKKVKGIVNSDAMLSRSTTTIRYKKPKGFGGVQKAMNMNTWEGTGVISVVQTQGLQAAQTCATPYSQSDLQAHASLSLSVDLGGAANSFTTGGGYLAQKFWMKTLNLAIRFTNQAPSLCEMEIWDVVSKVTKLVYTSPEADWATGLVDQKGANPATANTVLATVPTSLKFFNENWKVVKRTRLALGSGRTHDHNWNFYLNRILDGEYFQKYAQIRGITGASMFVCRGLPLDASNTAAVGNITTAPVKLVGYAHFKYNYSALLPYPKNNFSSTTITTGNANLYEENDISGLVENVMTAANIA
nr:MAG: capsid protein [Cressdnaviricota sp.]